MNPLKPEGSLKEKDRDKFMEELETARIASYLESRRQQMLILRAEWVPEARKEVAARKEFKKTMDIFPELVWEAILERVWDSKDKALMSNMTEMWWKLSKGERVKFLFQGIFSILHSSGYLSTTNDMLNCRLVCKEWKRSIDDYLQWSESKTDLDFVAPQPLPMLEMISPYNLANTQAGVAFLFKHTPVLDFASVGLDYSGVNPFISRKLILGKPKPNFTWDFGGTRDFWLTAQNKLKVWGGELWELTLCFNRGMPAKMLYLFIIINLELCPNLRSLRIICNEHGELNPGSDIGKMMTRLRETGQNIYGELLKTMNDFPHEFPDLPYLKSIQTTFVPVPIMQLLINKYGSNLESLCCGTFEAKPTDHVYGCALPLLKEFKSFYFAQGADQNPLTFTAEWPNLKELTLLFENVREGNILGLFGSINRFSNQGLSKLTLQLHKEDGAMTKLTKSVIKQLSLELPELEVMTLSVCRINLSSIDFLLPLAKLKELNLVYVKRIVANLEEEKAGNASKKTPTPASKIKQEELIKFSDYTNRLYESNIWRVFPELKIVRIGVSKVFHNEGSNRTLRVPTEQERLIPVRDTTAWIWNLRGNRVEIKRKIYTRDGYELHLNAAGRD